MIKQNCDDRGPAPHTTMSSRPDSTAQHALADLQAAGDPAKARVLAGFFKTGEGQYGHGDRFLGVVVPAVRQIARHHAVLPLAECRKVLASPWNEARLLALLILVEQYRTGSAAQQDTIYRLYLAQRARVNNWNLVDSSAPGIVGAHLLQRDRAVLYELAQSPVLWERRIAVLATLTFIRAHDFTDIQQLSALLLKDPHDLMHKACGWMLRELGKRSPATLHDFLARHGQHMPRTMLRYAIERLPPDQRLAYLRGTAAPQAGRKPSTER